MDGTLSHELMSTVSDPIFPRLEARLTHVFENSLPVPITDVAAGNTAFETELIAPQRDGYQREL
jgi:hypothetical protein